jgi:hypothetical protein
MADATGQPLDKIEEDTDRDFFMTPEEAMEYGIIDEVPLLHKPSLSALLPAHKHGHNQVVFPYACRCLRGAGGGEVWEVGWYGGEKGFITGARVRPLLPSWGLACGIEPGKSGWTGCPGGEGLG